VIPDRIRIRYIAFCVLAVVFGVCGSLPLSRAQQNQAQISSGIHVEPSEQVFATMCALEAAGFSSTENTLAGMALRGELAKLQGPATVALRKFYADHALGDPEETLSRFMAFALVADPPPQFQIRLNSDLIPPDVLALNGFQEVLAAFYREANLGSQWRKVQPEYERAAEIDESPVLRIVAVSNGYLREVMKSTDARSFTVYVEPPVGNRTVFRNSGDQYGIVVGSGADFPAAQVQHAYLHFLLDPIVLRNRVLVGKKDALLASAARAPLLPPEYHDDIVTLTDECLIKAVELRLKKMSPAQLEMALQENDSTGFVLVRPIVQQLQKFEQAEPAMSYYFPDILTGIDVQAEQKRLQHVNFTPAPATEEPVAKTNPSSTSAADLDQLLNEGDGKIAQQDAQAAAAKFEQVLQRDPHQPRAIYGLAIAAILSGQGDRAKGLFEELLSPRQAASEPVDPSLVAWSHVYLGRMHDLAGERSLAIEEYRAAAGVSGASEAAHSAGERGVNDPYTPNLGGGPGATQK
jgi:tetratricopeptide (TPR) repeat protein